MKYVILGLTAVTLMIAAYSTATAGNCTTNCSRTYTGGSTCNTFCY